MNELIADLLEVITSVKTTRFNIARFFRTESVRLAANFKEGSVFNQTKFQYPFDNIPKAIYFYYIKREDDGTIRAEEYQYFNKEDITAPDPPDDAPDKINKYKPIDVSTLDAKIVELALNARKSVGVKKDPRARPVGDFRDLTWRRRVYFVIFIDEEYWKIYRRDTNDSPILFLTRKKGSKEGTPNHTFYDGKFFSVQIPSGSGADKRTGIWFVNHMKSDDSGTSDVTSEGQYFNFNILIDIMLSSNKETPLTVIFDPGGTNQGPPLEP